MKQQVPIIFSVDDNYIPYLAVTLQSLEEHANKKYDYIIKILHTKTISEENQKIISEKYNIQPFYIEFVDISEKLKTISARLHVRDYYSISTYFRLFIPTLFPEYKKALYLDSDLVILEDISKLYKTYLGDKLIAAAQEEVMAETKVFGDYVKKGLGIPVRRYFNAGIIVMNLDLMRKVNLEGQFLSLLNRFKFEVTQDEDYLNVLCYGKSKIVDLGWNKTSFKNEKFNDEKLKIVHYKMANRPWKYDNICYGDYFWDYAKQTPYYETIVNYKNNYGDDQKENDKVSYERLVRTAENYMKDENNYKKTMDRERLNEVTATA